LSLTYVPSAEFDRVRALNCSDIERAEVFADLCRINTLYMIAKAGSGHIGTSFSCIDMLVWIFLRELGDEGHKGAAAGEGIFFSSKGHDAPAHYTVMTATGRLDFDLLHKLREVDGLPGHPDVGTPNVVTNTGSLGMGISKAKGMAFANRLAGVEEDIFVLTGDGELQEGQFWESLVSAANHQLGEIIAIVDHNKIQSDTWVSDVSDLGDLEAKFESFGWRAVRCDGNDIAAFVEALETVRQDSTAPKVIIADTIKGQGVGFMEGTTLAADGLYKYHSGAPSVDDYDRALDILLDRSNRRLAALNSTSVTVEAVPRPAAPSGPGKPQKMVAAYSRALLEAAGRDERIIALNGDLILDTGLIPFRDSYPERFVECGIAEQDMVSQAGGMALKGLIPAVHSFACFLSTRPNEQIYNNATEKTKIVYAGSLAGVLPGGPGHSHQSVRDIAALSGVPGLVLIEPCCESEVELAVDWAFRENEQSTYLRLVSIPCDIPYELPSSYRFEVGKGAVIKEGGDGVIFAYGPTLLPEAVRAAQILLDNHGLDVRLVNLPWLNRVDEEWLADTVRGADHVVTLDNHYIEGGQGAMIAATLAAARTDRKPPVKRIGLKEIPVSGKNPDVLRHHGLDAASLADDISAFMR